MFQRRNHTHKSLVKADLTRCFN